MSLPNPPAKGRSVRLSAPRCRGGAYRVLSATNLLDPSPGAFIERNAVQGLIDDGVKVTIIQSTGDAR